MSYTYLLEQGEESSAASFSDIPASALSKSKSIPAKSCCKGSATESCHGSRSGTTSPPLTATPGEGASMSSAAVSLAKTSALPEKAPESPEPEADSGAKWQGSFAKFDPDSSLWKTHQCSLLGGWEPFSETWPSWGAMRGGACWELATPARLTSGSGSGFLPTPRAQEPGATSEGYGDCLNDVVKGRKGWDLKTWPTPHGFSKDGKSNGPSGNELGRAVNQRDTLSPRMVPTKKGDQLRLETSNEYWERQPPAAPGGQMWPTPTAHNAKECNAPSESERNTPTLAAQAGGSLNPTWVEWLMGWPLAWTDLKPLGTDKFRQWRLSHGKS
jgi:hypothetical protein